MNSMKSQHRAAGIGAVAVVTVLFVAVTWAARPQRVQKLRDVVEQSVRKVFPNARIRDIEVQRRIVRLIEVTVSDNGKERDLLMTEDGTVLAIGQEIDPDDLPTAVRNAAQKVAGKAKLQEAKRIKVIAELRAVPIEEPRFEYEVEFRKKGKEQEIIISEDGTTIKTPKKLRFKTVN